jgi:subtilisin-like proprotein convertase family protein
MVVDAKNIYECKEIIKTIADFQAQNDLAIIKLDRSVEDREPLKIRTEGEIELGTPLVVIGHPSGLPTKIADSAFVRNNENPNYFVTNLDTFAGNSGSAVFNAETFEVEGILVRGETDYIFDYNEGCRVVNTCSMDKCKGEDVTRITNLKEFLAPYVDYIKMEEVEIINTLSFKDIGLKIEDFKTNEFEIEGFNTESINEIILNINITHTYSGDLVISLQHPTGKVVVLRNRTGANTDNVIQAYSIDDFEKLKAFQGLNSEGIWKLIILDNGKFDQGMLNELELIIK